MTEPGPEPQRPPPLLGTHTPARGVLIVGAVMLFFALVLVALGVAAVQRVEEVAAMTSEADATVVKVRKSVSNKRSYHYPLYRWEHEGEVHEHESPHSTEGTAVGDKVRVRFAPGDPALVSEDTWFSLWGALIPLGIGGLVMGVILFALSFPLVKAVRLLRSEKAADRG